MSKKITSESLRERFKVTPEKIDQTIKILVTLYNPVKIYLFGSSAHGTQSSGSDVDLMIIIPKFTKPSWEMTSQGYGALSSVHMPVDLILYDQAQFDRHCTNPTNFCTQIIKTGKLVYIH